MPLVLPTLDYRLLQMLLLSSLLVVAVDQRGIGRAGARHAGAGKQYG